MTEQAVYATGSKMLSALVGILIRCAGIGMLGHPGSKILQDISEVAARELKWDQARIDRELKAADKALMVPM